MEKPRVLLATQNEKKRKELQALADGAFTVVTMADVGLASLDVKEDGVSFAENAAKKTDGVLAALKANGTHGSLFAILADDSGIVIDALDGAPGIHSARFAAMNDAGQGDDANNALLLERLRDIDDANRTARFVCFVDAVIVATDVRLTANGSVEGHIARVHSGTAGFGYDPLFLPIDRPGASMAELSADDKHAISHRGKAMRAMVAALRDRL